ncbi:MAG: hypothetical protein HY736_12125 [Verrucomicrobia bacterium]|nr:hypothetical protein [Verrucomicrobiota bacterium]
MNDDTFENLEVWKEAAELAVRVKLLGEADAESLIADAKRLSKRIARLMEVRRKDFS